MPYWLGSFMFDYIILLTMNISFIVGSFAFNHATSKSEFSIVTETIGSWIVALLCMNFAVIGLAYLVSFRFEKTSSAQM